MGAGRTNKIPNASEGRDLTTSDFALGVGWGDGAVTKALNTNAKQHAFQLTITSVGSNQAQATATVVFTYPVPFASATSMVVIATTTNDNSIDTGRVTWSSTATALTLTHSLLPVATKIYKINVLIVAVA